MPRRNKRITRTGNASAPFSYNPYGKTVTTFVPKGVHTSKPRIMSNDRYFTSWLFKIWRRK